MNILLLSGGLDSSLITALASNVKNNIQTFSVSFSKDKKNDDILEKLVHINTISPKWNRSGVKGTTAFALIDKYSHVIVILF